MPTSGPPTDMGLKALRAHQRKVRTSLVVIVLTAVAPLAFSAFFFLSDFGLAADFYRGPGPVSSATLNAWHVALLVFDLSGLFIALMLGWRLVSELLAITGKVFQSESRLRGLMELSGEWYWQQDAHHSLSRIVYRGVEIPSDKSLALLPFVGMKRWHVAHLRLIENGMSWNELKSLMDKALPFYRLKFEYWPQDRTRMIFESTGRPLLGDGGKFLGYEGVSSTVTSRVLDDRLLEVQRLLLQGILLSAPMSDLASNYARGLKSCLMVHSELMIGYRESRQPWQIRGGGNEFRIPDVGFVRWADLPIVLEHCKDAPASELISVGYLPDEYVPEVWRIRLGILKVWVAYKHTGQPDLPEYWVLVGQKGFNAIQPEDFGMVCNALRLFGLCVERRSFENGLETLNKTLEDRVQERTARLIESNRELQAFSYTVSHDLRAPLRAIDGFADILREEYKDILPEGAHGLLERICSNARQMGALIDGLLDFSRLFRASLAREEVNLNTVLETVLKQLDASRRARIDFPHLPCVQADPVLVQQVWMNLIDNALKFTARVAKPVVQIAYADLPMHWEFTVQDNGVGFDMKYADKLFKVFERLHNARDFRVPGWAWL
ncbi:MAG: hypothetical protein HC848_04590 [Limnobacter sp.]|nr:hypothetical protein [Limnobacter sp.]